MMKRLKKYIDFAETQEFNDAWADEKELVVAEFKRNYKPGVVWEEDDILSEIESRQFRNPRLPIRNWTVQIFNRESLHDKI